MKHDFFTKPYILPLFGEGKKLEVRIAITRFRFVKVGDTIVFGEKVIRTVKAIRRYSSFADMSRREEAGYILPGATMGQIMRTLSKIYPPELERRGVLVFELSQ